MIRRYFWAWYWAQSEERAASDKKGWPTREEAIKDAEKAESALRRNWGPGKGFRLEVEERWKEYRLLSRALARDVLAVAVVEDGEWTAYIGAVRGENHDEEAPGVRERGVKLEASLALAIFPRLGHLAYSK